MGFKLGNVYSFKNDSIGHSFSCWKAAAVVLYNFNDITGIYVFFQLISSERNHYGVLSAIQNFIVVSFYKFF